MSGASDRANKKSPPPRRVWKQLVKECFGFWEGYLTPLVWRCQVVGMKERRKESVWRQPVLEFTRVSWRGGGGGGVGVKRSTSCCLWSLTAMVAKELTLRTFSGGHPHYCFLATRAAPPSVTCPSVIRGIYTHLRDASSFTEQILSLGIFLSISSICRGIVTSAALLLQAVINPLKWDALTSSLAGSCWKSVERDYKWKIFVGKLFNAKEIKLVAAAGVTGRHGGVCEWGQRRKGKRKNEKRGRRKREWRKRDGKKGW